ncbi:MAG: cation:proton antiporter [Bacteroidia bacterium]|jgi:Kef-type K+ transport system membrane component KefB
MRKYLLSYILSIAAGIVAIYWLLNMGRSLEIRYFPPHNIDHSLSGYITEIGSVLHETVRHDLSILIIQIITILAVSRTVGILFSRMGQPTVIGEILSGIILGPSLLGQWYPDIFNFLFPIKSLPNLKFLSQIGLILFMFVIGMELDLGTIRKRFKDAVFISHVGIIFPFTLGLALAYGLYNDFGPKNMPFIGFGLFMGISMSVTAFPVLARIIQERKLSRTRLGILALTTAAVDDISAWCLLAVVIAVVKAGSLTSAAVTIIMSVLYVLFMLLVLRPFMIRLGKIYSNRESISRGVTAMVFITLLASSWATEIIGIHALFGAFLAGVVMPSELQFRKILVEKTEDVSVVLLLPLFFVFTGLRTQINLLDDAALWKTCALIIAVAVAGKFAGALFASKLRDISWKDSFSLGALMNTRGLMELIVLNIGFDLGILNPQIFAMLVIMALFTTFMTGPLLSFIGWMIPEKQEKAPVLQTETAYKVLISFGLASSGRKLMRLAHNMLGAQPNAISYKAVHVTLDANVSLMNMEEFERKSFRPILDEADRLGVPLKKEYKCTPELFREVNGIAQNDNVNLLLLGAGQSLYTGSLLGNIVGVTKSLSPENLIGTITGARSLLPVNDLIDEKARSFILGSECDVAVLLDRNFSECDAIFVPLLRPEDLELLNYAQKFALNAQSEITVSAGIDEEAFGAYTSTLSENLKPKFKRLKEKVIQREFLDQQDLMLISYESWKSLLETKSLWIDHVPSVLIFRTQSMRA